MKTQEELTQISFQIISYAGSAKSYAIEAISFAKKGEFKEAEKALDKGKKEFTKAAHIHVPLIQKEAQGEKIDFYLIFMHAEDILLTTESLLLVSKELIDLHKVKANK